MVLMLVLTTSRPTAFRTVQFSSVITTQSSGTTCSILKVQLYVQSKTYTGRVERTWFFWLGRSLGFMPRAWHTSSYAAITVWYVSTAQRAHTRTRTRAHTERKFSTQPKTHAHRNKDTAHHSCTCYTGRPAQSMHLCHAALSVTRMHTRMHTRIQPRATRRLLVPLSSSIPLSEYTHMPTPTRGLRVSTPTSSTAM